VTKGGLCLVALLGAFLLAGTIGHDPWKPDEAYSFGLVYHILQSGEWVVPTLGGEPFMEKPPLYYLAAAASARLFSPLLPLHDGARLATTFFILATLAFTALAANRLFGRGHGVRAALLLLGTIGFAMFAHTLIPDILLTTGFAVAFYGLCWALERPLRAGALLGTGVGIGFMAKGLVEPSMVGIAAILLPAVFREWRTRRYVATLAWALLFALPWLLAWPIALYQRDPMLFREWFWINNFGRYFGFAELGGYNEPFYFTRTLSWFSLPAGILALYVLVRGLREQGLRIPRGLQLSSAMCAGILVVLGTAASVRELYALPILVPLCVLASAGVDKFPARLGFAASVATALLAVCVAAVAWGIWVFGVIHGHAPEVPVISRHLPTDFDFRFHPLFVCCALAICALWVATWIQRPGPQPWLSLWAANLALGWGVVMTLLLPWLDNAKSFREPFESLAAHLQRPGCIASIHLGEGQRAMLDYMAHRTSYRAETTRQTCPLVLMQTLRDGKRPALPQGEWTLLWQGSRNGENKERFLLYANDAFSPILTSTPLKAPEIADSLSNR